MGANTAADFTEDFADDPTDDRTGGPTSELYLAVASMRANSVRMKAIAQTPDAEAFVGDHRSESRRPHVAALRTDYERMHTDYAREGLARSAPPTDDAQEAPLFRPQYGQLDAAAEHLERGRLPDLNALAEMMIELKATQRAYEVNLQMVDATHAMMTRTVDLLKR